VARELLADGTVEDYRVARPEGRADAVRGTPTAVNVLPKPGVMDPAAESVQNAIAEMGLPLPRVRTGRRYYFAEGPAGDLLRDLAGKALANDAIEQIIVGSLPESAWGATGSPYVFRLVTVPIREMNDDALMKLSREGQLYLNLAEMQTIREHFRKLGRDATDAELETLAQTWSEHCSHKTLKGKIEFTRTTPRGESSNLGGSETPGTPDARRLASGRRGAQSSGVGALARAAVESADSPCHGEPLLADVLRHGPGQDRRGLRRSGRAAQPPGAARLARDRVHRW
jgi:phosphoribosylformylglycinamidine (FGAM) synthase PurS component